MNSKNNNEKRRPLHEMTSTSITVYRNGDRNFLGKKLVLNRKYIRNFDTFLDKVTYDTQAKVAVRSIRTPNNGTRILNLENFENGGVYVAVGFERFKQLPYKDLRPNRLNPIKHVHQPQNVVYKPVLHSRIHASARHLKIADSEPLKNRIIYVYRNGDERFPGLKLLLDKRILQSMESVLQHITDKVKLRTGAVKSLYTVDGVLVKETRGLETGSRYIAVGYNRPFVKAMYTKRAGVFSITPRKHPNSIISNVTNSPKKLKSAVVPHKEKKATTKEKTKPPTQDDNPVERGGEDLKLQYVKDQAFGGTFSRPADDMEKSKGKKKKGDEEENVRENEEGVVTENPELPSVFQATGENKVFGTEVMEGQETHIEQTVEMMAAEEINDEEIDHPQQTTKKLSQVSEGKDGRAYTSP